MKSIRYLAFIAVFALVAAACGGGGGATTTGATGTTGGAVSGFTPVTADTLTLVTSLPAPGFWEGDDPANITGGFEYEMAQAIQAKLGMGNLEIVNVNFDELVAGTVADYDLALSQVTITTERAAVVDFTVPYFNADQGAIVNAGTVLTTLDEAKALLWGVQTGTTGEIFVNETLQPTQPAQTFQDLATGYAALSAGQVDAFMMDTVINLGQAAKSNGALEVPAQFKTGEQYGGILPKGSTNADAINAAITALIDDGTLAELSTKWLGGDPSSVLVIEVG